MARFAPVAPPHILRQLRNEGVMGNYHLLLAHYVAAEPELYRTTFDHLVGPIGNDPDACIIMDNSLWELGHPVDVDTMFKACKAVPSNLIVLPDYLTDMERTLEESRHAAEIWGQVGLGPFMGVCQGKTMMQIIECGLRLMELPNVKALGIPRIITDKTLGSRGAIVRHLHRQYPETPLHLLGFSVSVDDDMRTAQFSGVVGIDSSEPIRVSIGGEVWSPHSNVPPRGDYWDYTGPIPKSVLLASLETVRARIR